MAAKPGHCLVTGGLLIATALSATACARPLRQASEPPTTAATTSGTGSHAPGDTVETIVSSGETRHYRLHVPPSYQPGKAWPLVISLHGYSSNGTQQERFSKMSVKADQAGFIAVYPEGRGDPQAWYFGPGDEGVADLAFIRDLIHHLESQLSIDPARIYATGISNGAQMTDRLGCSLSDQVATIAPVSGGYPRAEACRPVRPVPVVSFHGTADNLLPYEGLGQGKLMFPIPEWAANWAARNGCNATPAVTFQHGQVTGQMWGNCREGADVVLYTVEGGGHSWPGSDIAPESGITTQDINATDVIWGFFAAHPKP
jgi:polyhydroxybutyrate depolymerase